MAKSWSQVEQSAEYKSLSFADRAKAKMQYWQEVISVKPEFQKLSAQDRISARNEFFVKERNLARPSDLPEGKARQVYREYGAPLAHALSTLAFGIPRLTARATGAEELIYPEQRTLPGKISRVVTEIPALVLGGIGKASTQVGAKLVPKLATETLKRKALRTGLEGATFGALSTPREGYLAPEERLKTALSYGIGSGAIPYAGAGAKKIGQAGKFIGRTLAKDIGMLGEKTMNTINRLGLKKIRDVASQGGAFLTDVIIPKAKKRVVEGIAKLGNNAIGFLEDIGFQPQEVRDLLKVSKENMSAFGDLVSDKATVMMDNISRRRNAIGAKLGELRNVAEKNGNTVDIRFPLQILRRELRKYGFVDFQGLAKGKSLAMPDRTIDNLMDVYNEFKGFDNLSIAQFKNFIYKVEAAIGSKEKFNISAYMVRDALNKAEDKALGGITYLRNMNFLKLKKDYSDMVTLENLGNKLNKVLNEQTDEHLESTFNKLKNYLYDPSRKKFIRIYGKDLLDDIDALSAAIDLYPDKVRGGLLRTFGQEIVKGGYILKEGLKNITTPVSRVIRPVVNTITGGFPQRQLSLIEALRQISNQEE